MAAMFVVRLRVQKAKFGLQPTDHPLLGLGISRGPKIPKHSEGGQGWGSVKTPARGSYGFDTYAGSACAMATALAENPDADEVELARAAHEGWVSAYNYWVKGEPWRRPGYRKPFKPLGDERRERCASTSFDDLPKDEEHKDRVLARAFLALAAAARVDT
jgi:hypothetical protein